MLKKRQAIEEKKFHLQQEEFHLKLEAEVVKTSAKKRVYTAMTTPSLPELKPLKLETEFQDQDPPITCSRAKRMIPREVPHPGQDASGNSVPFGPLEHSAFAVGVDLQKEAIGLQRQQTIL